MTTTTKDLDDLVRGAVDAACWADIQIDGKDETGSNAYTYGVDDLTPQALAKITEDCERFLRENEADLIAYCERVEIAPSDPDTSMAYAGHDFWLTRRGHGTGFWDRGMGELGDRLAKACKAYSEDLMPWLNNATGKVEFD